MRTGSLNQVLTARANRADPTAVTQRRSVSMPSQYGPTRLSEDTGFDEVEEPCSGDLAEAVRFVTFPPEGNAVPTARSAAQAGPMGRQRPCYVL
jgi:hypothetical protein